MRTYKGTLKQLPKHLEEGETVEASCFGAFGEEKLSHVGVMAVTQKRVLLFSSKWFGGYELDAMKREDVESVQIGKSFHGHTLTVRARVHELQIRSVHRGEPERVAELLRGQ